MACGVHNHEKGRSSNIYEFPKGIILYHFVMSKSHDISSKLA